VRHAIAILLCLAAAVLAAGCQSKPRDAVAITAPENPPPPPPTGTPNVVFDSTRAVALRRDKEQIEFFVTNVGTATAYHVRAYWHLVGTTTSGVVDATPATLSPHQSGFLPVVLVDVPSSAWPLAPDSLRWSATP